PDPAAPDPAAPDPAAPDPSAPANPAVPANPAADPAPADRPTGPPASPWDTLDAVAFLIGFLVYLYMSGLLIERVRLSSARLPADLAPDVYGVTRLLGTGLRATLLGAAAFTVFCAIAYIGVARHWTRDRQRWHDLVTREEGSTAPLGEAAVRIVAGVNTVAIAALVAFAPARFADERLPELTWLIVLIWVLAFLLVYSALLRAGPARWGRRLGGAVWTLLAAGALFVSAPLGIIVLATAFLGTFGRVLARLEQPQTVRDLVRSPLPWALLATVLMVSLAYAAVPPASFPTVTLETPGGREQGAYLGRTGSGVYIATCRTSQTDAVSAGERVTFVPAAAVRSLTFTAHPYRFDSGKRPSLLTLVLHAAGAEGETVTLLNADLRSRAQTCDGAGTEGVSNDAGLGAGVLVGPGPAGGRALDGEQPIQGTAPHLVSELARRYQPTLLVTAADRNWPVSLEAVLAERGADGSRACLVRAGKERMPTCGITGAALAYSGASGADYLQLPTKLELDSTPSGQFEAFMRGQQIEPGEPSRWLADPALLKPWSTAQIYFYLADPLERERFPKPAINSSVPERMIGLEYWFYYPYNYYPAVFRRKLMEDTPLAAESVNFDNHQGDWEHVDVLLDPQTLQPQWLYLARHGFEGTFIRWANADLVEGHPVVQAAYGGHPSYERGCGPQPRPRADARLTRLNLSAALVDLLVCGSGRLGFRAATTPLVDLASVPWACWPGHFGEASFRERSAAESPEFLRDVLNRLALVAGPEAPLLQAENRGVCSRPAKASEQALLRRLQKAAAP
ncbi:MAG: hypothetical protein ACYDC2_00095, partial [Solirubrobacteraceae bacterium]